MQESLKPKLKMSSRIVKIVAAVGFALVISSFGVGPARAADNNRGGGNHVAQRGGGDRGDYRGGGGRSGPTVVDNYYAPQPDYYASPEPYNYYGNGPDYDEPAPQGINLFFGL